MAAMGASYKHIPSVCDNTDRRLRFAVAEQRLGKLLEERRVEVEDINPVDRRGKEGDGKDLDPDRDE